MSISLSLDSINVKVEMIIAKVVSDLQSELIKVTPVDTGNLKGSWELSKTLTGWEIRNSALYASVIFDGRRVVAGKTYGSESLPDGIDPILKRYNLILESEFNKIRV